MLFPVFAESSVEYRVIFVAVFVLLRAIIAMPAPTSGLQFTVVVQDNQCFNEENFTRLTSTVEETFRW